MRILATFICSAASVAAARAVSSDVPFSCPLSASGSLPATHYASSGLIESEIADQLSGLCSVTTGPHNPAAVIAAAGLLIANPSL